MHEGEHPGTEGATVKGSTAAGQFYGARPYVFYRVDPARWVVSCAGSVTAEFVVDFDEALPANRQRSVVRDAQRCASIRALIRAKDWASSEYGVEYWRKDEWGCYGDARIVPERLRRAA